MSSAEWGVRRTRGAVGTVANFAGDRRSAEKAARDWPGILVSRTVTRSEWSEAYDLQAAALASIDEHHGRTVPAPSTDA